MILVAFGGLQDFTEEAMSLITFAGGSREVDPRGQRKDGRSARGRTIMI